MLKGRIKNINSTKYIVDVNDKDYTCVLRGIFRKEKITPLVGDYVEINEKELQITKILPRKNYLHRPNIANVDIALIITSVKKPDLDLILLDKLLVHVLANNIRPVICFTKTDLLTEDEQKDFKKIMKYYKNAGYDAILNENVLKFKMLVHDKVVVTCGQTGAGKSTFINMIDDSLHLETNPISESLNRGVHTTRYVSLYKIENFYIADTPGFSSLDLTNLTVEQIRNGFNEFSDYPCQYHDCSHINTDGCNVFPKVGKKILESRYNNYKKFIKEHNESSSKLFKK
ncbi:MAG: ribosome small subunit-dependent GTPase A [Firmicutes bacterium]|nr:ribosome small subunit-dependent GTPase A [Bacillota bacterium]